MRYNHPHRTYAGAHYGVHICQIFCICPLLPAQQYQLLYCTQPLIAQRLQGAHTHTRLQSSTSRRYGGHTAVIRSARCRAAQHAPRCPPALALGGTAAELVLARLKVQGGVLADAPDVRRAHQRPLEVSFPNDDDVRMLFSKLAPSRLAPSKEVE
jgi:hypothetical protein